MRLSSRLKAIEALTPTLKPISSDPCHAGKKYHAAMVNNTAMIKQLSEYRSQPRTGESLADKLKMGSQR